MTYSEREFGASQSDYPKEQQMSDTDIVSRMRHEADQWHPSEKSPIRELREGADEIERLRAGRAAVVEECAKVADEYAKYGWAMPADVAKAIRALGAASTLGNAVEKARGGPAPIEKKGFA
jgi:hypothetical protein